MHDKLYCFHYFYSSALRPIAYNVQGWRRFASPAKGLRSKTRAGKMWWKKTAQRAYSPTAVFWNPEGANSARSANRLLNDEKAWLPFSSLIFSPLLLYSLFSICQRQCAGERPQAAPKPKFLILYSITYFRSVFQNFCSLFF